ncbi:hypothetical protein VNO77_14780 [Canavalia gladiata]|uniref:Uncharacterized protein n=1 Tax=Canavalia gladiata TaxID=3824 RepID=A0AAN9LZ42_CANGL
MKQKDWFKKDIVTEKDQFNIEGVYTIIEGVHECIESRNVEFPIYKEDKLRVVAHDANEEPQTIKDNPMEICDKGATLSTTCRRLHDAFLYINELTKPEENDTAFKHERTLWGATAPRQLYDPQILESPCIRPHYQHLLVFFIGRLGFSKANCFHKVLVRASDSIKEREAKDFALDIEYARIVMLHHRSSSWQRRVLQRI